VAAALSVAEAVRLLLGLELRLKWPNDLLLPDAGERKVCGILSESATRNGALDYCITGIGINLRKPPCLSPEVAERSGWLSQGESRNKIDGRELLPRVVEIFFGWVGAMEREGVAPMLAAYRGKCASIGRVVRVETGTETLTGTCSNIGDDGELVVETPLGTRHFHVADVTHARLT
jgi:BirA family biotin operon repressor/biotin-[acetyl-CoA-carboxylase] ligase